MRRYLAAKFSVQYSPLDSVPRDGDKNVFWQYIYFCCGKRSTGYINLVRVSNETFKRTAEFINFIHIWSVPVRQS